MILPFKGSYKLTQGFNDPCCRASYAKFGLLGHNGWDFGMPVGTKLLSPHNGKVTESLLDVSGYGWYIKIENDIEFSVLGHMSKQSPIKVGTVVRGGDEIGLSGNTGNSTGPHLHWGYGRNPRNRDNGFNGYIDQTYWMDVVSDNSALEKELDEMRDSRNMWKQKYNDLFKDYKQKETEIVLLNTKIEELSKLPSKTVKDFTSKEIVDELLSRLLRR